MIKTLIMDQRRFEIMSLNFYLEAEHKYDTNMIKKRHKVDRCLARYSPRAITTNQLTNRAPNEPARPICAQKSIFLDKSGHFWAKHPNYVEREQKFWYPLIRKPPCHLICIIFWSGMGPNGPKMPKFGPK